MGATHRTIVWKAIVVSKESGYSLDGQDLIYDQGWGFSPCHQVQNNYPTGTWGTFLKAVVQNL
jgi:hypothetical protein